MAEFCRREGVTEAVFYYWRRRSAGSKVDTSQRPPSAVAASAFLPVEVMLEQKLEIELPGGAVVRCPLSSSGSWRQVLEAVSQLTQKELRGC